MVQTAMEFPELTEEHLKRIRLTREEWEEKRNQVREREKSGLGVGDAAPDFELPYLDDRSRTVRLSSFKGRRPVALIFGSYT